jgi:hypothetical protein
MNEFYCVRAKTGFRCPKKAAAFLGVSGPDREELGTSGRTRCGHKAIPANGPGSRLDRSGVGRLQNR